MTSRELLDRINRDYGHMSKFDQWLADLLEAHQEEIERLQERLAELEGERR